MLLGAGFGTRLGSLTADRPKCMIPVAGREILLRNLDWLRSQGVEEVVINLHHRGEAVEEAIGDGSSLGMKVAYSREPELLGTAGGVLAARFLIGDSPFLVVYADNLYDIRLASVVAAHQRSGATVTMAVFEREDVSASGVAVMGMDGWVVGFQEKPLPGTEQSHWVNAGLLVCGPDLYDVISTAGGSDLSRDVLPLLARHDRGLRGYCLGAGERVLWIDTMRDLRRTETLLATSSAPSPS